MRKIPPGIFAQLRGGCARVDRRAGSAVAPAVNDGTDDWIIKERMYWLQCGPSIVDSVRMSIQFLAASMGEGAASAAWRLGRDLRHYHRLDIPAAMRNLLLLGGLRK